MSYKTITSMETKNKDYANVIKKAKEVISCLPRDFNCEIIDESTGEILFNYRNGHICYIQGEFAKNLFLKKL